jgi:hypothetical protein
MTEDPADASPEHGPDSARTRPHHGFSAELVDDILRNALPVIDWGKFNPLVNVNRELVKQQNWLNGLVGSGIVPKNLIANPVAGFIASTVKQFADMQESLRRSFGADLFSGVAEQQRRLIDAVMPKVDTSIWSGLADTLKVANADWQKSLLNAASIGSWLGPDIDGDWLKRLISPFTPETLEGLRRLLESARPDNWAEVDTEKAQSLVAAGWPLVWVPRGSIVAALLAASDDAARKTIILDHADDIIDDVAAVVEGVKSEELAFLGDLAIEAVNCTRNGQFRAAQAAATVVVDTVIRKVLKLDYNQVRAHARSDFGEVPLRLLVGALCRAALAWAFEKFWVDRGDPEPDSYNRHASIHAASEKQYTRVNALLGLMTAASLLRQVDRELSAKRCPDRDETGQ